MLSRELVARAPNPTVTKIPNTKVGKRDANAKAGKLNLVQQSSMA